MALISDKMPVASSRANATSSSLKTTASSAGNIDIASPHRLPMVKSDLLDHAKMIIVVDTNYFLSNLNLIRSLSIQALNRGLVIVIPKVVVQELDGLKLSTRKNVNAGQGPKEVSSMARAATRFLEESLGYEGNALRCQKRSEFLERELINDDQIIDCCLYFMETHKLPVAVLSQDRSLNVKARANGCATCGEWSKDAASLIAAIENALLGSNAKSSAPMVGNSAISMPAVLNAESDRQMTAVVAGRTRIIAQSKLRRPPELHSSINGNVSSAGHGSSQYPAEVIDISDDDNDHSMPRKKKAPMDVGIAISAANTANSATRGSLARSTAAARARKKQHASQGHQRRSLINSGPSTLLANSGQSTGLSGSQLAFGHFSTQFTFNVPSYLNHTAPLQSNLCDVPSDSISAQSAHRPSPIVIQDSDDDMEIDSDHQEQPVAEASRKRPSSRDGHECRSLQEKLDSPPHTPVLPQTDAADASSAKPVVIYLDDSPRKESDAPKTAFDVSSEIVVFLKDSVRCGLTKVLCDQLKKRLPLTYAESWTDVLKRRFEPPPWNSTTTILTAIACYWSLVSQAFHRRDKESIQRAIPWVMKLEGVSSCPQTTAPLPSNLQFEQLALSLSNKSQSCIQRQNEEAAQLVALAKSLLAQCALVENEAQEKLRHYYHNRWSDWLKNNAT